MENVGILPNGEWNSFTGMFSTEEETNFMAQLLGNYPFPSEQDEGSSLGTPSTFWPCHEATINMAVGDDSNSYYSLDTLNSNAYYFSQGSSYSSGSHFFPTSGHESYYLSEANPILVTNNSSVPIDMCMVDEKNSSVSIQVFPDNLMEEIVCMNDEMSSGNLGVYGGNQSEATILPDTKLHLKRKSEMPKLEMATEDKNNTNSSENPKKKSRISGDVQKNKKNVQLKKNKKLVPTSSGEEEGNVGGNRQSSSSYCSEDDSNASQELNGGTTSTSKGSAAQNLDGKRRASRGSATDPQSLYARKRRERINERLRILQNLVPNGTKVDISTMLEEAVQYVKFLQLQIKLLSSDDLWMYAPIACNGVNIGLDLEISPLQ